MKEIKKTKEPMKHRESQGFDQGRPPIGLKYDDAGERWVQDREGQFDEVIEAIRMVEDGASYRDVQEELEIAPSTLSGVLDRKELFLEHIDPA